MSTYAYKDIEHTDKILTSDINKPEDRNRNYFCPGCNCIFRFRAQSSNAKIAHFFKLKSSNHDPSCWVPYRLKESGYIEDYNFDDFLPDNFFNKLLKPVKKQAKNNSLKNLGNTLKNTPQYIHTIRQLYKVCCLNPDDTVLNNDITVRDIFCGQKTSYFYTSFCQGFKLIEARFYRYNKGTFTIFLTYPFSSSADNNNFFIQIQFKEESLFYKILKRIFDKKSRILIYSDWTWKKTYAYSEIINEKQPVLINKGSIIYT